MEALTNENVHFEVLESSSEAVPNHQDVDILASFLNEKKGDLSATFNSWMVRVKNGEVARKKIEEDSAEMKETLSKQLHEGMISYNEYLELEYINRLWIKLLNTMNIYRLGTVCNKRDVVSILLELFNFKQISNEAFINAIMEL